MSIRHEEKLCKNGLLPKKKHVIVRESGNFWAFETNTLNNRVVEKYGISNYCVIILSKLIPKLPYLPSCIFKAQIKLNFTANISIHCHLQEVFKFTS
jgi:hypothetical protein